MKVKNLFRFLGVIILVYLLIKIDLNSLLETIKNINMPYFLIGILLSVPMLFIKAMRFDYLTDKLHKKYKNNLFLMYFFTLALGIFTPGKVGELSRVYYLKKHGASGRKSFFIVSVDRIFDVITFSVFGMLSMLLFTNYFVKEIYFLLLLASLGLLALILIYIFRKRLFRLVLNKFDRSISYNEFKEKLDEAWKKIRLYGVSYLLFLSVLSYLIFNIEVLLFAKSLSIPLTFMQVIILVSISSIINMIPINISGIGTRDATFFYLFSIFGLSRELAISLSLTILFFWMIIYVTGVICGFLSRTKTENVSNY